MGRFVQRNRWRRGRWLVIDDESGFVEYSDKVVRRWDGMYVRKDQNEPPDPQWYISAPADPPPVPFVRPDEPIEQVCQTIPPYINGVLQATGPGTSLYVGTSIGSMEIECSFTVFPDLGPKPIA